MPTDPTPPAAAPTAVPLLIDALECARLCGVSRVTWFAWQASGAIPAAVLRRGRVVRWSRQEVERWIAAGCPARDRWAVIRGAKA